MNALAQQLDLPEENLLEDEQKELIVYLQGSIEKFGLKETIDCLISAIELRQESLEDDSKEYKDLQLLAGIMTSVSTAADAQIAVHRSRLARHGLWSLQHLFVPQLHRF